MESWQAYGDAQAAGLAHVVQPSIPILYFGDWERYATSPIRIITVGLNPSSKEFPSDDALSRFPAARDLGPQLSDMQVDTYLRSLNAYFRTRPYSRWFDPAFESILAGLGASYYGAAASTALHTDLCSPLATCPTWSKLSPDERASLERIGTPLWHDLVELLQPHVVLASIRRACFDGIKFAADEESSVIFRIERQNPYKFEAAHRRLESGGLALFVFGKAAQLPFGTVSKQDKRRVGERLKKICDAR